MKKTLLYFILNCFLFRATAQQNQLKISFTGADMPKSFQAKAFFVGYNITKKIIVDTVSLKKNALEFVLNDTLPAGLYQVMLYTNMQDVSGKTYQPSFDVIVQRENVALSINMNKPINSPEAITIIASATNISYYQFLQSNYLYQQKTKTLETLLQHYPKTIVGNATKIDPFYTTMQQQKQLLAKQQQLFYKSYANSSSLPALVKMYVQAQLPPSKQSALPLPPALAIQELKHSPFITQVVWNYLYHYKTDSLNNTLQQQQLIKGIETLMPILLADKEIANQLTQYLTQQFDKIGMADVVLYLNEKYLQHQTCENPQQATLIAEKINTLKQLQIGEQAPNIVMDSIGSKPNNLHRIIAPYTLLVFWESNCSHCQQLMPQLNKLYAQQATKKLEVLAVSLDSNKEDYINYIVKQNLSYINYADLKGWKSPIVKQYAVTGTPTMLLLDKDKKIIAKPLTVDELLSSIK